VLATETVTLALAAGRTKLAVVVVKALDPGVPGMLTGGTAEQGEQQSIGVIT
jgi:hypothetical protein